MFPRIGLFAGLVLIVATGGAQAQNNIDQGKSPAEIFASDCGTCHKSVRGLAAGKNSLMLSSFLREHYTASRDEASALAAYVLGSGGNEAAPRQKPEKPSVDRARATGEEPREPKSGETRAGEAKPVETRASEPKGAARPMASAKPEKPEEAKPETHVNPTSAERQESRSAPAEAAPAAGATPSQSPAPVVASQPASETSPSPELPGIGLVKSAAVPEPPPSDVPRDHIPD